MGIFDRLSRLFRANVNAAISAAENPEVMLTQITADMRAQLAQAKQRRAEAQRRIAETMSSLSDTSAFDAFARMEERIDLAGHRARANAELDRELSGDQLAVEFKALETAAGDTTAELQLQQLKQRMGILGSGESPSARRLGARGDAPSGSPNDPRSITSGEQ